MVIDIKSSKLSLNKKTCSNVVYRADIDGLRALAITIVVLYHAFPSLFFGGFVGVDVFFVISGFLISSIIFKSIGEERFSFSDFYIRRIKRLFPSLIVVLISCYFLGDYFLLYDEFELLGKHFITGLGFSQNIKLYLESGYFDTSSKFKPLMHLWSLGIEEQFYLLFPAMVIIVYRLSSRYIWVVLVAFTLFSFVLNIYFIGAHPSAVFYLPLTRFWELLIGSLLAYFLYYSSEQRLIKVKNINHGTESKIFFRKNCKFFKEFSSFLGLALIVFSIFFINDHLTFPGWWAMMPVTGAMLIIAAGQSCWVNQMLLSNKLVVGMGLISYPLYLWHWPLLAFANILEPEGVSYKVKLALVALSVLLAWLTFVLIEKPIRFSCHQKFIVRGLLSIAMSIATIGGLMVLGIVKPNSHQYGVDDIVAAVGEWEHPQGLSKMSINNVAVMGIDGLKKTLFIGDSNADQYSPRVVEVLKDNSIKRGAVFLTGGGCLPIPGVSAKELSHCDSLFEQYLKVAEDRSIDRVVIAALWHHYLADKDDVKRYINGKLLVTSEQGRQLAFESLDSFVHNLSSSGRKVYIVLNIPIGRELDPKGMIKRDFNRGFRLEVDPISKIDYISEFRDIYAGLKKIASRSNVEIIDPLDYLCDEDYCYGVDNKNKAMYKDSVHLRPSFVRENVTYIDKTIRE